MRLPRCAALLLLTFWLALTFAHAAAAADESTAAAERKHCLSCHAKKGAIKKFSDGDSVSTYVDPKAFERSIHGSLPCSACHEEFSERRHPDRVFRTKQQYQVRESRRCLACHPDESINARPIHQSLFKKEQAGQPRICTNCHNAHSAQRVRKGAVTASEEQFCMRCHRHAKNMQFAAGGSVSVQIDMAVLASSVHRNLSCSDCHRSFSASEHPRRQFRSIREYRLSASELCRRCHYDKQSKVADSIHYSLVSTGRLGAPTCVDCHGGHAVTPIGTDRLAIVKKCAQCHAHVYAEYAQSVHGSALRNTANQDVPTCIDCHSSHTIRATRSAAFHDTIPDTCSGCHGKQEIMAKYGLSTAVVRTYLSDFHGMTLQLQRKEVRSRQRPAASLAVCSDCHGSHSIARAAGGNAAVIKSNLLKRCQSCHPNASENFPDIWLSHYEPSLATMPLIFVLGWFYRIMLVVMVVGLVFQIVLDIRRRLEKRPEVCMSTGWTANDRQMVRRFSIYRIIEHLVLIALFFTLVLTGLPQKFHQVSACQSIILVLGGIDTVRLIHHIAGGLFLMLAVQHIVVNFIGIVFRQWDPSLLITLKDVKDSMHNARYYLGLLPNPALCGRFTYKEKCVYWLVLIGGIQMIVTGFMLWFPVLVTKYLPGQFIPAAKIVHSSEAMITFLLVATWHMYEVIFSPDVFPINKSIFTGFMKQRQAARLHPLEMAQRREIGEDDLTEMTGERKI